MLTNDKVWLDGRVLALSFVSKAACIACAMLNRDGSVARHTPTAAVGSESSCRIDLTNVPPGDYALAALTGGGPLAIGGALARRHARRQGKRNGLLSGAVAKSSFAGAEGDRWALLYVDPEERTLRFRLSTVDDADAFLAALPRPAETLRFSVISPCYNVARYLDDFFESIVNQSLDFRSHIELIMVDDGSTDETAKVIRRWQKRYPEAIRYFRKTNGGPAAARNFGLDRASHEWITFIDPDDFVDTNYFAKVANTIRRYGEDRLAMISCNLTMYEEATGRKHDNHALRYRHADGERALPATDLGRFIQLHINVFLKKSLIDRANLRFDSRIRPSFEDAHFFSRYLSYSEERLVVFLPSAQYFYRRRRDQSSLINSTTMHPEWYGDQLQYGYLALLSELATRLGTVPRHVQYTIIYEILWRLRHILDRRDSVAFLGDKGRRRFRALLDEIFEFIDTESINDFDIVMSDFFYKVGIFNLFKNSDPPQQCVVINALDWTKGLVRTVHWSRRPTSGLTVEIDGTVIQPAFAKRRRRDFMGETFCWEHISWLPLSGAGDVALSVDGMSTTVRLKGVEHRRVVPIRILKAAFSKRPLSESTLPVYTRRLRRLARSPEAQELFRDAWLFMDRDTEADDNAEHLYRWVRQHKPDVNAFFVLRGNTPDWKRLQEEGFRLLTADAPEHAAALLNAKYLISSHADAYVHDRLPANYFGDLARFKYVFLQHGVTMHDVSDWLNAKPISCFVTATPDEYSYISGDGPFTFTNKEVVLKGFPRHDSLLRKSTRDCRTLVIMPTWRSSLAGRVLGPSSTRLNSPNLARSEYAIRWRRVLNSAKLRKTAEQHRFKIVIVPHKAIEADLDAFHVPQDVEVRKLGGPRSIQDTFGELSLFVTDYTSAAFDAAYLYKPVMYYQFDREFVFGGGHSTRPGYFDYERDGFGPVFTEEDELIAAVEAFMEGSQPDPIYRERAAKTFPFRDGKCCERVFQAILDLEQPYARTADQAQAPALPGKGTSNKMAMGS